MEVSILTDPGPQIGRRQHLKVMNDGWTHKLLPVSVRRTRAKPRALTGIVARSKFSQPTRAATSLAF